MRRSKYDKTLLAPIVASSRSLSEVLRRLGLKTTGGNHRMISARIRQAGVDRSHFHGSITARCAAVPRETIAALIPSCTSVAQVLAKLELPQEGRPHRDLTRRIRSLGLDTSHFRGSGWSRGETRATSPIVDRIHRRRSWPDEQVFVENGPLIQGPLLARRLLALGWPYRCAWCELVEWRGTKLVLHLDHVNGINNDNRLENLRFLCPNCHSQTDTYSNRRRTPK